MDDDVVKSQVHPIELDEEVSLYSFIGQDRAVSILKAVANQYINDKMAGRNPQLPSIQIRGYPQSGRRTLSLAFANSVLGCPPIKYTIGKTLSYGGDSVYDYIEDSTVDTVFFISGAQELTNCVQTVLYKLLREQILYIPMRSGQKMTKVPFPIKPLMIFSICTDSWLIPDLRDVIDLKIEMEKYTEEELFRILKQRCKYCGWKYSSDEVLRIIAQNANCNPGKSMTILKMAYSISRGENRDIIKKGDTEKAVELLVKKKSKD